MHALALVAAAALGGVLVALYLKDRQAAKAERAAAFDSVLSLFEDARTIRTDRDFPVLVGRYRGYEVVLELALDLLAVRKLPTLWLMVSVRYPIPYAGVFDYLSRPGGSEYYSPSNKLPVRIDVPPGWPAHAMVRTDRPDALPAPELLAPHMAFFDDVRAKELLVTPRGVRLVFLVAEAMRSQYLVLREVRFESLMLPRETVRELIERALALVKDLTKDNEETSSETPIGKRKGAGVESA